jgi:hypothetical protein
LAPWYSLAALPAIGAMVLLSCLQLALALGSGGPTLARAAVDAAAFNAWTTVR